MWMLLFLAALGLLAWLAQRYSLQNPRRGLTVHTAFSARLVDPEQPFFLTLTAENSGRLPISYLEAHQSLPAALLRQETRNALGYSSARSSTLRDTLYLGPRQRLTRQYPLQCGLRGAYRLSDLRIYRGDLLGLQNASFSVQQFGEVVVAPRPSERRDLPQALGGFLGQVSVQRFLMEDPVITAGFGDYTGREPQKDISWRQSARAGKLIVKKYDHTAETTVAVLLDITDAGAALEECFSLARSVCEALEDRRQPWAFYTDANLYGSLGRWGELSSGSGRSHLFALLEGLGRADSSCRSSFSALVERLAGSPLQAAGYLVLRPRPSREGSAQLNRLRSVTGSPVLQIFAEEGGRLP